MHSYLQEALDEIQRATDGMSVEQLAWHPEGKWNSAQILEHLRLAFSGTTKGMRRVLDGDGKLDAHRTMKHRLFTFIVTGVGYFPSGRKAPEMVVPGAGDPATAVQSIVDRLVEMDGVLADVERKKGTTIRVPHPVMGPLTIPQWRKFHRIHTKHHMKQIVGLRESQR